MNTTEALKQAMQAVKDAEIPEDLWPTALPLALADLRRSSTSNKGDGSADRRRTTTRRPVKKRASKPSPSGKTDVDSEAGLFETAAIGKDFLDRVAHQTDTNLEDLRDVFHVEDHKLQLKILPRNLGETDRAKVMTVTALIGGAAFGGTNVASVPFSELYASLKAMRCFNSKHAAEHVRETPGFGSIGSKQTLSLTHKKGWEAEFGKAIARVLKKQPAKVD